MSAPSCPGCGAKHPNTCTLNCQLQPHAMQIILSAVARGATLKIETDTYPRSGGLRGTLESHVAERNPRYACETTSHLGELLVNLAGAWKRSEPPNE